MFAILRTGGKQYRVSAGDLLTVERLNAVIGDCVTFDDVLMLGGGRAVIGTPTVPGASVSAKVERHVRCRKVIIFKKRRRKNSRRKGGHRQQMTTLRIEAITGDGTVFD